MSGPNLVLLRDHAEWCRREATCADRRTARLLTNIATACEDKVRELSPTLEAQSRSLLLWRQKAPRLPRRPHPHFGFRPQQQEFSGCAPEQRSPQEPLMKAEDQEGMLWARSSDPRREA